MHKIQGLIPNVMCIRFFSSQYVPVRTEYTPSTYILVHTCNSFGIPSTKLQTSTCAVGTVLYWRVLFCVGVYHAIVSYHLVLLCSSTYHLVMQLTILRISTFHCGTRYIQICKALMYQYVLQAVQRWYGTIA